jgi:hypothetical protein
MTHTRYIVIGLEGTDAQRLRDYERELRENIAAVIAKVSDRWQMAFDCWIWIEGDMTSNITIRLGQKA